MTVTEHKHSRGFTVVELMIALTLGVLLLMGLVQIFQSSNNLSRTETGLSRVQEVGRYAMDLIASDIRMVGYYGCADPNNLDVTIMAEQGAGDFATSSLEGFEVSSSGVFAPAVAVGDTLAGIQSGTATTGAITARPGSDVVRIKYAELTTASLVGNTDPNNANVVFNGNPTCIDKDDLVVISDCSSAHIFRNTNNTCNDDGTPNVNNSGSVTFAHAISGGGPYGGNNTNKIEPGYGPGASLLSYRDITYFVGDTGRNTTAGDPIYALYRIVNGGATEELLEGVEFMKLQYAERLDSGNLRTVTASDATLNMLSVSSVKLGMLIQDFDNTLPQADTTSYEVAGINVSAAAHSGGKYMRKAFSTTVKLRNRRN
ncbi:PilW family protein [Pseudomaricurvus sp. HS19]|uniref:PilW family protein n=1 Tax=Pseudomaricurvus sp. HS19 TaxID=2692626 RepID=UPI00137055AC|nr:PilW family protein [Pseudomaricurvus sp. HS19]MYM64591.1 hypothetical protein [Pseudomaricurvus sp. HS19]